MAELPPSRKRARAARALGLRPRSGLMVLAGLGLGLAGLLELGPLVAARWLSARLELGFTRGPELDLPELAAGSGAALLALLGIGLIAAVSLGPRRRARRALGVDPQAEQLPAGIIVALTLVALGLSVGLSLGVLAGAARSVEASPESLAHAWLGWLGRGLLGLALAAGSVGVIERLVSARRLWQGLHQTPTQARAEARAAGRRAPRYAPVSPDPGP
ncbi:MAG: hypothetical protein R6X02_28055 [Enhygromyxa sp.]